MYICTYLHMYICVCVFVSTSLLCSYTINPPSSPIYTTGTDLIALAEPVSQWVQTMAHTGITAPEINHNNSNNSHSSKSKSNNSNNNNNKENAAGSAGVSSNMAWRLRDVESAEEALWCPVLGLKGQIDAIVTATGAGAGAGAGAGTGTGSSSGTVCMPFELKTGKASVYTQFAHRAQVMLYVLLMMVRSRLPVQYAASHGSSSSRSGSATTTTQLHPAAPCGVLLYLNQEVCKSHLVVPTWAELRALAVTRNALASASQIGRALPQVIQNPSECESCFQSACVVGICICVSACLYLFNS